MLFFLILEMKKRLKQHKLFRRNINEDRYRKRISFPSCTRQTTFNQKENNQCKKKGNRGELDCVNILKERFPGKIFSRTMGSGNYTGGKNAHNAELLSEEKKLIKQNFMICLINRLIYINGMSNLKLMQNF